jgi:2-amino-4-hydroxy-6-hydroxymethyldihydropteridine diphosphokinase
LVAMSQTLIGLGGNCPSAWGDPSETLRCALAMLNGGGVGVVDVSRFYETAAVGQAGQRPYVNAVARIETAMPPEALLRHLKEIERTSGRRGGSPWGSRTLDLDILDYKSRIENWRGTLPRYAKAGAKPLVLPHPWIEKRPFVLRPLLDVAPDWRHPVTGRSAKALWRAVADSREGRVMRVL